MDATKASPICQKLVKLIQTGLPEEKKDCPEELTSYVPYRRYLTESEGVIRCGNRTVIPAELRPEALNILHEGHAEVTTMLTKATRSFFWPKLRQDIIDIKAHCQDCMSPSNSALPPTATEDPAFPFRYLCMGCFHVG